MTSSIEIVFDIKKLTRVEKMFFINLSVFDIRVRNHQSNVGTFCLCTFSVNCASKQKLVILHPPKFVKRRHCSKRPSTFDVSVNERLSLTNSVFKLRIHRTYNTCFVTQEIFTCFPGATWATRTTEFLCNTC